MRESVNIVAVVSALIIGASISANAADLVVKAPPEPPPVPVPVFSWTGFYIGGNLGAAWGQGNVTDAFTGLTFSGTTNAVFIGGGQVGFNYQVSSLVFGVEGDFDWAGNNNNRGSGVVVTGPLGRGHSFAASVNNGRITTLTGRLGVAWNRALFYAKGGRAWLGNNGFTVTDLTTGTSLNGTNSNSATGWTVGAGLEWAFANNWSTRVEYDFIGLGSRTFVVPATFPVLAGDTFTANGNVQMFRVGLNYLF